MGPKLMNCCRPEQRDTKEFGKMVKGFQILEEGRVPTKEAKNWRIEGDKKRIKRIEFQRILNKFEMESFMAQKGLWNFPREKILVERGALLKQESDAIREYKAMNEEISLSSWLREGGREKEERMVELSNEKRRRAGEQEENETETVKRRCEGLVEALEIFRQEGDLESCCDFSLENLLDKTA